MTFREKYKLDHNGEQPDINKTCPSHLGYIGEGNCLNPVEARDVDVVCNPCWNREMPPRDHMTPCILDSGERRQFETGAVRDIQEGKGRCDLMPLRVVGLAMRDEMLTELGMFLDTGDTNHLYHCLGYFCKNLDDGKTKPDLDAIFNQRAATMFLEVAKHFEEGAKKYGENNWQKGLPVHCYIDSAVRHYLKWLRGDKDEPHDRAFVWNLMCCIWEVDFSPRAKEETSNEPIAKVCDKPEPGAVNIPDGRTYSRLGDCGPGLFEFAGEAYVKTSSDSPASIRVIRISTGDAHWFSPDILVHPLEIWKADGDEDE